MKEYKVVSMEEGFFSDRFSNTGLEDMLNKYAREGWIVKTVFTDERPGLINVSRKYCVFVLEREVVNKCVTQEVVDGTKEDEQINDFEEIEKNDNEIEYDRSLFWKCEVCDSINSNDEEMCPTCGIVRN